MSLLPRLGSVEDVANAALFLASNESSFTIGHDLVVDGGSVISRQASLMPSRKSAFAKALQ
jgi:NAD(P)-dependent dehydrogenase (short-subunit alcohol dehydrogenase family)